MEIVQRAARRLIREHGHDAPGEAFTQALDARARGFEDLVAYWIDVAVEIMHAERSGKPD